MNSNYFECCIVSVGARNCENCTGTCDLKEGTLK